MILSQIALMLVGAIAVAGQRPTFAGLRPIGYPELYDRTTTPVDDLGNRFGEGTTERLPLEANGDRDLIDRISKLPLDQQPFWYINWKALEEHRKKPQTYPLNTNSFIDPNANVNSATGISNIGQDNSNNGFNVPNGGSTNLNNAFTNENIPNQGFNNGMSNINNDFQNRFSTSDKNSRTQNSPNANLDSNPPNFDFLLNTKGVPSVSNTPTKLPYVPQNTNIPKIQSNSNFPSNAENGGANTMSYKPPTINVVPSATNIKPNFNSDISNFSSGFPNSGNTNSNNVNNTNTQIIMSSSNSKNANTGVRTSSNFETENINTYFVNGKPPAGVNVPGFNTSEDKTGNSQQSNQQGVTDVPNSRYSTYSYGYQNQYKYKYNYHYETPYTIKNN